MARGDQMWWNKEDAFTHTLAAKTLRIFLAITAYFDLEAHQLDAVAAFLNEPILISSSYSGNSQEPCVSLSSELISDALRSTRVGIQSVDI